MKDLKELSEKKTDSDSQQPSVEQPKPSGSGNKLKKRKRPEDIAPCVEISIEILEQFM